MEKELTQQIVFELFKTAVPVQKHILDAVEKPYIGELIPFQVIILYFLNDLGLCPMKTLVKALGVTHQRLTKPIDDMVVKGYIERLYDENNRSLILIQLTDLGKQTIANNNPKIVDSMHKKISLLSSEDRNRLYNAASIINEILSKWE